VSICLGGNTAIHATNCSHIGYWAPLWIMEPFYDDDDDDDDDDDGGDFYLLSLARFSIVAS